MADFEVLKNALLLRKEPKRIPLVELLVDEFIKEKVLGKKVESLSDEIELWVRMGYDFMPLFFAGYQFSTKYRGDKILKGYSFVKRYTNSGKVEGISVKSNNELSNYADIGIIALMPSSGLCRIGRCDRVKHTGTRG